MSYRTVVLVCLSLAAGGHVWAADEKDNYAIWGKGGVSCHKYNKARATGSADAEFFSHYAQGYITAFNAHVPETYDIASQLKVDDILKELDTICEAKQIESFEIALQYFIDKRYEQRAKSAVTKKARWP